MGYKLDTHPISEFGYVPGAGLDMEVRSVSSLVTLNQKATYAASEARTDLDTQVAAILGTHLTCAIGAQDGTGSASVLVSLWETQANAEVACVRGTEIATRLASLCITSPGLKETTKTST